MGAGMVGTPALRGNCSTRQGWRSCKDRSGRGSSAGPVQSSGGMFAQLAADLPWAPAAFAGVADARPAEQATSLAVRDGDDTRCWQGRPSGYREHQRLHRSGLPWPPTRWRRGPRMVRSGVDGLPAADRRPVEDRRRPQRRLPPHPVDQDAPTVGRRASTIGVRGHRHLPPQRRSDSGLRRRRLHPGV